MDKILRMILRTLHRPEEAVDDDNCFKRDRSREAKEGLKFESLRTTS